jgi:hypothetical protein
MLQADVETGTESVLLVVSDVTDSGLVFSAASILLVPGFKQTGLIGVVLADVDEELGDTDVDGDDGAAAELVGINGNKLEDEEEKAANR